MSSREWRFYVDDMIGFLEKVVAYSDGLDQNGFVTSGLNYDATVRNFELIGEAVTHSRTYSQGLPGNSLTAVNCHAQSFDPWVLGDR